MKILVINAGSSSLKYQLFDMEGERVLAKGLCERIGIDGHLKHSPLLEGKKKFDEDISLPTHAEAIAAVIEKLTSAEYGVVSSMSEINAVGHRVVHGGEYFSSSVLITDEVMKAIETCVPLAPLHNPANITGINACKKVMGDKVPQVAVFDTAYHQTMPGKAFTYAIPKEYYEKDKIRRYGFHGTSHRYVATRAAAMLGKPISELKLISCHMGNGSSVCAIEGGKSVDTSMGFTPLVGLPMGTRCGDLDSGVLQYLMNKYGISIDEMINILNKKSGVLGVSGISSDFRDLDNAAAEGNKDAQLALDLFHYEVAKVVGSYAAAMNGVDAIIFTAGIGENSKETRAAICEYFGYLGCTVDREANTKRGEEIVISTKDSKVKLLVIPTNEELVIARDTKELV
ncbi:MAG: acetate kinase [Firmicutes bacterium HGW-Firmicutes-16]|nr:MAG: acetate kinase [Firmicutes bacterium HGW-Firmicutes-16]